MGEHRTGAFNVAAWLVDRHVDEGRGDRVAIRCQGRSTTYAELQRELWRAQALLAALGVAPGDRLAMVVRDDEAFPSLFLGAQRSGIVAVPLSTMLRGPALGEIVADSGAVALAVSDTFAGTVADIVAASPAVRHVIVAGDASSVGEQPSGVQVHAWGEAPASAGAPVADTTEASPAFWLYSSGTTGIPKGVMHVHGNPPATHHTYAEQVLQVTPDDRFLSVAKLFFAYGLGNSLTFPFAAGATAILNPAPPTPAGVAALLADERPTLFFSSPGFCAALLDAGLDPSAFTSVRASVTAGESLPADIQKRFAELTGSPVLDGIGSTELLHIFISNTLDRQEPGASGWVVPGYEAELRGDDGEVVDAADTPGYLHVRGESAARGYWQRPDATATAFCDGWVRTGDVYVRSDQGHWTFLGRNSDMIKAGGIWVSPAEVESALIEHPAVLEAAVVGARDAQGLETVVAFVVPASGATPDPATLEQHCRDRLAAFKRPRRVLVVDELPKTATGKIKRFELRDSLGEHA
jgi:benzoate-CoA ligase family protein